MQDKHPYLVSLLVFSAIFFMGRIYFLWGQMASAFLVLFYFLILIGIRLDEIVKKINAINERLEGLAGNRGRAVAADTASQGENEVPPPADAADEGGS
jgi:hypothetical protein